jgi:hypothetical protein
VKLTLRLPFPFFDGAVVCRVATRLLVLPQLLGHSRCVAAVVEATRSRCLIGCASGRGRSERALLSWQWTGAIRRGTPTIDWLEPYGNPPMASRFCSWASSPFSLSADPSRACAAFGSRREAAAAERGTNRCFLDVRSLLSSSAVRLPSYKSVTSSGRFDRPRLLSRDSQPHESTRLCVAM